MGEKEGGLVFNLQSLRELLFVLFGIAVAGFGLEGFLIPNGFIDGGITGISLLIHFLSSVSVSILLLVINLPFIFLAKKQIGKAFAVKTFFAILGLSLCLLIFEYPVITSDKILASIFGGVLLGAGIGLSVRGGCVLDGTEVLSIYLNRKINWSIGEILLAINIIIFTFAAVLLSLEVALYSILTYFAAYRTMDFFIIGIEEYMGVVIISEKSSDIRRKLVHDLKKGVTIYKGKGGFSEEDKRNLDLDILYTILTRMEVTKIKKEIKLIDPNALIIEESVNDVSGGRVKKRPLREA